MSITDTRRDDLTRSKKKVAPTAMVSETRCQHSPTSTTTTTFCNGVSANVRTTTGEGHAYAWPDDLRQLVQRPGRAVSEPRYVDDMDSVVVNNVELILKGGFAHVYLVRTAEPVFGTTHHVLKRIAVANETMLGNVKKEVDIMARLSANPTFGIKY